MMVVSVEAHSIFKAGMPKTLFEDHYDYSDSDVAPDSMHFLMIRAQNESAPNQLTVVMNWLEDLKRARP